MPYATSPASCAAVAPVVALRCRKLLQPQPSERLSGRARSHRLRQAALLVEITRWCERPRASRLSSRLSERRRCRSSVSMKMISPSADERDAKARSRMPGEARSPKSGSGGRRRRVCPPLLLELPPLPPPLLLELPPPLLLLPYLLFIGNSDCAPLPPPSSRSAWLRPSMATRLSRVTRASSAPAARPDANERAASGIVRCRCVWFFLAQPRPADATGVRVQPRPFRIPSACRVCSPVAACRASEEAAATGRWHPPGATRRLAGASSHRSPSSLQNRS